MATSVTSRRAFVSSAAASALPAAAPRKPNLLFLLADQWRAQTLPGLDRDLIAPNLARLAEGGVRFDRVYASNPVCTPSRASLITGRFPHACRMPENNLLLPLEEHSIGSQMKKAGYATGYIGKWHLDGEARPGFVPPGPRRRGFDYWAAFNRGHFYYNSTYYLDRDEPIRMPGFEPDYQTSLAVDFIRRNRAQPFYLYLSWGPPHTPRTPPPEFAKTYDPAQFHLRPNVPADYEARARKGHAGYYGLCSALDRNAGRLLGALDELGLAEDTIVVFSADHGDMLGSQGLEYKGVWYEESARVPLIVRYPRRMKPGVNDGLLISNVDFVPTLLSLCGAAIPEGVQGRDLSRQWLEGKGNRSESLYAMGRMLTPNEWRMVVRGFDKLVVDASLEATHLYNLGQDPFEQTNLAALPEHRRTRDEMKALLADWMRRTGDRMTRSGLRKRG